MAVAENSDMQNPFPTALERDKFGLGTAQE